MWRWTIRCPPFILSLYSPFVFSRESPFRPLSVVHISSQRIFPLSIDVFFSPYILQSCVHNSESKLSFDTVLAEMRQGEGFVA